MRRILIPYKQLQQHILFAVIANFFLQLINAAFTSILNFFMLKESYTDYSIADYTSYRYLGVLVLALPIGLYIKGRKLKPLFHLACIGIPLMSLLIIYAVNMHFNMLLYVSLMLWGVAYTCLQIAILPYILRNANKDTQSEAISLNYATGSVSTIVSGFLIYIFNKLNPSLFDEKFMLQIFSILGLVSIYFFYGITKEEEVPHIKTKRTNLTDFDWVIIMKGLIPTLIIAVGAGLAIPFMNLFFESVHHLDFDAFSLIAGIAGILVTIGAIIIPMVKRKYGYTVAITWSQAIAVLALILMTTTEFYSEWKYAVYLAVLFFLIRQPFMNIAGPMTSELIMNYVGKRNQEIVSALTSAIWSGSWFISSRIFKVMRESGFSYATIFLITAAFYIIGVIWYQFLINDFHKRQKAGLVEI